MSIDEIVKDFKESVAPDLYSVEDIVRWEDINRDVTINIDALMALDDISSSCETNELATVLQQYPTSFEVIKILLSLPTTVGFIDGRDIPTRLPQNEIKIKEVAELLSEIGVWNVLKKGCTLDLFRVAQVAKNAPSRRFSVTTRFSSSIAYTLNQAVINASEETGKNYKILEKSGFPAKARGRVEHIVVLDNVPIVAISSVFQATSGGRQQRDLTLTYPDLQNHLNEIPVSLVLIADGLGLRQTPDSVLKKLFLGVGACMTLKQASSGSLKDSIIEFSKEEYRSTKELVQLAPLVEAALTEKDYVVATELPASLIDSKLALSKYVNDKRDLRLKISGDGSKLEWARQDLVTTVKYCIKDFDHDKVIDSFIKLLNATDNGRATPSDDEIVGNFIDIESTTGMLSEGFLVLASKKPLDYSLIKICASIGMQLLPTSKYVILITHIDVSQSRSEELRRIQNLVPKNVVTIDVKTILEWVKSSSSPLDRLREIVLNQSDLTKISPFVLTSATPERMFFGREAEEATILGTLPTNSVALIGGRRIGKTSLLKHSVKKLPEIGFSPFYLDCQTVRNWFDFSVHASKSWNTPHIADFKPHHLLNILESLAKSAPGKLIILLDEIDQLLDWDQNHTDNEVPEAFFRACRTASQQDLAQFIFSGERLISKKIWDPHSPHWNFCRALLLRQLPVESSVNLLLKPLKNMNIDVINEESFGVLAWELTSGHPQLIQELGDRLIKLLNLKTATLRGELTIDDLKSVAETYDYAEHYLETYWGQSDKLERVLSLFVANGITSHRALANSLYSNEINVTEDIISKSMRMLDLYGIVSKINNEYSINIEWFSSALSYYGGISDVLDRYVEEIK